MYSKRFKTSDARPVNQNGFVGEWPEVGLIAMGSPNDSKPSITLTNGFMTELDGKTRDQFGMTGTSVAGYGTNLELAEKATTIDSLQVARMPCGTNAPRTEIAPLTTAMTPAKLTGVVSNMSMLKMIMVVTKLRARRQPASQYHVTNIVDNPVQIATDSVEAALCGSAEQETTVGVVRYTPFNAPLLLVGARTGRPGILTQCVVEEATELQLGMRGPTTYIETMPVYGTEAVLMDDDNTPWSKTSLASSCAPHGLEMRFASDTGSEAQIGYAEGKSMLYLEACCLFVIKAAGSQSTQNGSVNCIGVPAGVPGGIRAMLAKNLIVTILDLKCVSSNDQTFTHSNLYRVSRSLMQLVLGINFIYSGCPSIPNEDNMFASSSQDVGDFDDWNIIQHDLHIDGGLTPAPEEDAIAVRRRAARALQVIFDELGLSTITDAEVGATTYTHSFDDMPRRNVARGLKVAEDMMSRGATGVDVAKALSRGDFKDVVQAVFNLLKHHAAGDHLYTSMTFDADFNVVSAMDSPSDYYGLQTGYQIDDERRNQIKTIRQAISPKSI